MKKYVVAGAACVLAAGCLSGCGGPSVTLLEEPVINYGESDFYSQEDMDAGIAVIQELMEGWEIEYNLQDISYAGDELSSLGTLYIMSLTQEYEYDKCMVFLVDWVCLSDSKYYTKNKLYEDQEWYIYYDGESESWNMFTNGYISQYMFDESETSASDVNILPELLEQLETSEEANESEEAESQEETEEDLELENSSAETESESDSEEEQG